ncbi:hypothetical protein IVA80_16815 [Bradyrhizobium sp. 139]|uniref:hypothetical protein n=1 Tax=Bradyrhizobium sp. 139 TaxID=2782616 RepID=UPI001FFB2FA2|nr:hypothetical protein [Bradyrhizobium sp. 139]MCK1742480.1 hypothetical protein [Bradyrhizobium sp. 139]
MMAQDRATARGADQGTDQGTDRGDQRSVRSSATSPGEMALQSSRCFEAAPQTFVRLTGSHLAKPRVSRAIVTE